MSTLLVVDEWLFHDLLGQNEDKGSRQEEAWVFIYKLLKNKDKIIILEGSPFEKKMNRFIKQSENDVLLSSMSKTFHGSIVRNSSKAFLLSKDAIKPIPKKILAMIPKDDIYLFEAHLSVKGSVIVTSDGRWPEKLKKHKSVKVIMRDQFLKNYK